MRTFIPISELDNNPHGESASKVFGDLAERIIFQDFSSSIISNHDQRFIDNAKREENLKIFLLRNNPHYASQHVDQFVTFCKDEKVMRFPDIMIHTPECKEFYEIKPNSRTGLRAGEKKVGVLRKLYKKYNLPYKAGIKYNPTSYRLLALYKNDIKIGLRIQIADEGFIVYDLLVDYDTNLFKEMNPRLYGVMLIDLIRDVVFCQPSEADRLIQGSVILSEQDVRRAFSKRITKE